MYLWVASMSKSKNSSLKNFLNIVNGDVPVIFRFWEFGNKIIANVYIFIWGRNVYPTDAFLMFRGDKNVDWSKLSVLESESPACTQSSLSETTIYFNFSRCFRYNWSCCILITKSIIIFKEDFNSIHSKLEKTKNCYKNLVNGRCYTTNLQR